MYPGQTITTLKHVVVVVVVVVVVFRKGNCLSNMAFISVGECVPTGSDLLPMSNWGRKKETSSRQ